MINRSISVPSSILVVFFPYVHNYLSTFMKVFKSLLYFSLDPVRNRAAALFMRAHSIPAILGLGRNIGILKSFFWQPPADFYDFL